MIEVSFKLHITENYRRVVVKKSIKVLEI